MFVSVYVCCENQKIIKRTSRRYGEKEDYTPRRPLELFHYIIKGGADLLPGSTGFQRIPLADPRAANSDEQNVGT